RVTVTWQIATDPDFTRVVRRGEFVTGPERDHTVKIDAAGLTPATDYFYRFGYQGSFSRTGRTRTAPAAGEQPQRLRFGMASCANWQAGHFAPYRRLAERGDLDAMLHLATTSTSTGRTSTARSARTTRRTRWSRCPTTGGGMRSTKRIRACRLCTPTARGSSRGTTTRRPTTHGRAVPATTPKAKKARGPSGERPPSRPTASGCRSGSGRAE